MRHRIIFILSYIVLSCLFVRCSKGNKVLGPVESVTFEIYVSSDDISDFEPVPLEEIALVEPPILTRDDISGYDWKKHHITYPASVWEKLKLSTDLLYKVFVIKVNGERIYWGRFLRDTVSGISLYPVIPLIQDSGGEYIIPSSILIELAYLAQNDPRNDERMYDALSDAHILVEDETPHTIPPQNSFSIYITTADIYTDGTDVKMEDLTLLEPPLLTTSDISCYSWGNHHISYPDDVWERLKSQGNLLHKIFVVCLGDERMYWGSFMDMLDSLGSLKPVIWLIPRHPDGRNTTPISMAIERESHNYDPPSITPDLRDDQRIYNALDEAGVLVDMYK
ncbi:hypothetical protein ACFL6H_06040 [Candidatus Latescibacterota bacterium]